jgi:TonB family protein
VFIRNLLLAILLAAPAFAADTPLVLEGLISSPMPRFPAELIGIKAGDGEAVMVITIDPEGVVEDSVALEATNAAFARAATEAVRVWKFTPGTGTTWPRREVLQFNFKRSGVVTTLSHAEGAREQFIGTPVAELRTVQVAQLDQEPKRIASAMPKVAKSTLAKRGKEPLVINFVIDRDGQVRVPVITAVDDPDLAQTVLAAVKQWRYTPPLQKGEPVAVEVTRELVLPGVDPQ